MVGHRANNRCRSRTDMQDAGREPNPTASKSVGESVSESVGSNRMPPNLRPGERVRRCDSLELLAGRLGAGFVLCGAIQQIIRTVVVAALLKLGVIGVNVSTATTPSSQTTWTPRRCRWERETKRRFQCSGEDSAPAGSIPSPSVGSVWSVASIVRSVPPTPDT